jgi:hypothetical protein
VNPTGRNRGVTGIIRKRQTIVSTALPTIARLPKEKHRTGVDAVGAHRQVMSAATWFYSGSSSIAATRALNRMIFRLD